MHFNLDEARTVLSRTPGVLWTLLAGIPRDWVTGTEGGESWSPYDIVGHLVHGERTDWIPRARLILEQGEKRPFDPYDRFAQFRESEGKPIEVLLDEFRSLREANLHTLDRWQLKPDDLDRRGRHPDFGPVTLGQLLAAWVVHDLGHIGQAVRVMAKQYRDEVGPWSVYLPVLSR